MASIITGLQYYFGKCYSDYHYNVLSMTTDSLSSQFFFFTSTVHSISLGTSVYIVGKNVFISVSLKVINYQYKALKSMWLCNTVYDEHLIP